MDKRQRKARAQALINDEMFGIAKKEVGDRIVSELLNATTPEEREDKFYEHKALKRLWNKLEVWAAEAE